MKVAVVGAGVMGLCITRSLRQLGDDVVLIDAQPLTSGKRASSDHTRLIRTPYGEKRGYRAMVLDAFGAWDRLWDDVGECFYQPTGVLLVGDNGADWITASLKNLALSEFHEIRAPQDLVPGLVLTGDQRAWLVEMAGVLFADEIMRALRDLVGDVPFRESVVSRIDSNLGQVHLASGDVVDADRVVISTGAWPWPSGSPTAARTPSRQTALYLDAPAELGTSSSKDTPGPFILDLTPGSGYYYVPAIRGYPAKLGTHTFSGIGHPEADRQGTQEEMSELLELRRSRVSFCADWPVSGCVANYYDVSPDERFIARFQGAGLWLGGFSGHGFKFAPLIGEHVASVLTGRNFPESFERWLRGR